MSSDDYAGAIIQEGQRARDEGPDSPLNHPVMTERGIKIALATALVESNLVMYANEGDPDSLNFPHEDLSRDANSVGLFQQRAPWWGTVADRMDPARSAAMFYHALNRLDYNSEASSPGSYAQQVQQSAFPDRYDERFEEASDLYNRLEGNMPAPTPPENRPDFNEYSKWSSNCEGRNGETIDLWLIHTQEGDGNADSLANFLISTQGGPNPVSYHYTVSEDLNDHGVTVVDVVDTDQASWSALNANDRSINLCFAGSRVAWTREQWMQQSKAIEAAAYLCVQDCNKYGISKRVITPPYDDDPPGISDHRYVTEHLGIGSHSDVGDNFPWDYFADRVNFWANPQAPSPPPGLVV